MCRAQYSLIHRLETNKLRNVAKFFAHLLSSDAISWEVFQVRATISHSALDQQEYECRTKIICRRAADCLPHMRDTDGENDLSTVLWVAIIGKHTSSEP